MNIFSEKLLIFLLLYVGLNSIVYAYMQCPTYKLHFQKIVGYRPSLEDFSNRENLLFRSNGSFPINSICWLKCNADQQCMGYVLVLSTPHECYGYSLIKNSRNYNVLPKNYDLVVDSNVIYFEKTCLNVPESCKTKLYAITRIPGSNLVYQGRKTISTLVTRRKCAEHCIFETEFQCLSASFSASFKNNYARLGQPLRYEEIVGRCILSNKDKTLQPDTFRVSSFEEEYIENQCLDRPAENDNCSYELYANSTFIYSEFEYFGLTQKECQRNCSRESRFHCQGISYTGDIPEYSTCSLHSEDIISMGPRSLLTKVNSVYMRRVKCLDVSVVCTNDEMIIRYSPADWFRGKLYVSSHSEECSIQGNGTKTTTLRLPIGNEFKETRCGIIRAYEVKATIHRTFISTLVVVQNNANVQTQGDRLIKVGCILNNGSSYLNGVPDDIALESSLAFTQTEFPNEGSLHINSSGGIPKIYMHVIDLDHNYETNDVQIGQNLELQIIADPPDSNYDIQAVSLIAKSTGHNFVYLIDNDGCPTDITVFPALEKVITKHKKMLRAKFHAFKFSGTSLVSFDVMIHFCLNECPPVSCSNGITSYGKRKRRNIQNSTDDYITNTLVEVKNPFTTSISYPGPRNYGATQQIGIYEYQMNDIPSFDDKSKRILKQDLEVPLKIQLHVRNPYLGETESLIYGENSKILVANLDNERIGTLCINQSLLIALLIFWIIFQIIIMIGCCYLIRKYKRNAAMDDDRSSLHKIHESLEYAESNRRVHWADQGSGGFILT